jgi:hypothetical protein
MNQVIITLDIRDSQSAIASPQSYTYPQPAQRGEFQNRRCFTIKAARSDQRQAKSSLWRQLCIDVALL